MLSRYKPRRATRPFKAGNFSTFTAHQTCPKRPPGGHTAPKNRHIRRTNQYELCTIFGSLYAFRSPDGAGRGVTPVVSQNKKPLLLSCFGCVARDFMTKMLESSVGRLTDRLNAQVMALLCAVSACPCLGFVPNALLIPLSGKYRREEHLGVLSSIAVCAKTPV